MSCGTSNITPQQEAANEFFKEYVEGAEPMTRDECAKLWRENNYCGTHDYWQVCDNLTGEGNFSTNRSNVAADQYSCDEEFKEMLGKNEPMWDGRVFYGGALYSARIKWLYENADNWYYRDATSKTMVSELSSYVQHCDPSNADGLLPVIRSEMANDYPLFRKYSDSGNYGYFPLSCLANIGELQDFDTLKNFILSKDININKQSAMERIAELDPARAFEVIKEFLKTADEMNFNLHYTSTLSLLLKIGGGRGIDILKNMMESHADIDVRHYAAWTLSNAENAKMVLQDYLWTNFVATTDLTIANAMFNGFAKANPDKAIELAHLLVADTRIEEAKRLIALGKLIELQGAQITDMLVNIVRNEPSMEMKEHALSYLVGNPTEQAMPAYEFALDNDAFYNDHYRAIVNLLLQNGWYTPALFKVLDSELVCGPDCNNDCQRAEEMAGDIHKRIQLIDFMSEHVDKKILVKYLLDLMNRGGEYNNDRIIKLLSLFEKDAAEALPMLSLRSLNLDLKDRIENWEVMAKIGDDAALRDLALLSFVHHNKDAHSALFRVFLSRVF